MTDISYGKVLLNIAMVEFGRSLRKLTRLTSKNKVKVTDIQMPFIMNNYFPDYPSAGITQGSIVLSALKNENKATFVIPCFGEFEGSFYKDLNEGFIQVNIPRIDFCYEEVHTWNNIPYRDFILSTEKDSLNCVKYIAELLTQGYSDRTSTLPPYLHSRELKKL